MVFLTDLNDFYIYGPSCINVLRVASPEKANKQHKESCEFLTIYDSRFLKPFCNRIQIIFVYEHTLENKNYYYYFLQ